MPLDDRETPILAEMIVELGEARDDAEREAAALTARLSDVEALHEPDAGGDCPTCMTPAPCVTSLLLRGQVTLEGAFAHVRDAAPIDLIAVETEPHPPVPSLAELLAAPTDNLDRFFDALLQPPPTYPAPGSSASL